MAFPDVFVDEVRRAADIVRVVSDRVSLKKLGASWKGLCPFHQEKTPSFNVRADPPLFHCFGCGEGGDVFKFVMLHERCSFPEAVESLARRFGVPVPELRGHGGDAERRTRERLFEVLEAAALHFTRHLWGAGGRVAREYLEGRGFRKETLERVRAGAALDSWDDLATALGATFPLEVLLAAGLVIPGKDARRPYDRFRQRAVFPILNEAGRVVAFGARSLDGSEPKYLNSPETAVYQKGRTLYGLSWAKDAIRRTGRIVLMEGYLDVARAIECGVGEAVATCGTALTPSHARLLRRFAERVVLNFDQDEAGQNAARRSFEALAGEGLQLHVVELPVGHDPDSFLREFGAEAYGERLDQAPPFVEWALRRAAHRHPLATPPGQAAYAREILPVIARVPDEVERSGWFKRAAELGGIERAALERELRRAPEAERPAAVPAGAAARPALLPAETWLLTMLVNGAQGVAQALQSLDEEDVAGRPSAGIWREARALLARGAPLDVAALAAALPDDALRRLVTELALRSDPVLASDLTPLGCVYELKCLRCETRIGEIRRRLVDETPQGEALDALLQEQQQQLELKQRLAELARTGAQQGVA